MTDFVLKSEMRDMKESDMKLDDLRDLTKKHRLLLISSNTGAWEYFPKQNLLDCNKIYFAMLGRDIDDFQAAKSKNLDNVWTELIHPDDRMETISRFFDYLVNPVGMFECFFRMSHANGDWIWICSRGGALKNEKGVVTSLIGTHVDITRQKLAEEEIQRERILLRTLIDNLPDTIYVKDAEGRKIIANKADVACIGRKTEAEVIGKTDRELFPNEIGERGYQNDMEVLQTGKAMMNREEFFYDEKSNQRWLSTSKVPVYDKYGHIDRILGIGHDITERKQSEEALKTLNEELHAQSIELKALNEQLIQQKEQEMEKAIAQGKFEIASEVLHDIGNALVGIGSYLTRINRVSEKNSLEAVKNLNVFLKGQQALIGSVIGIDKATALVSITDSIAKTQSDNQKEITTSTGELLNIVSHIQEILNIQRQFVRSHGTSHERRPVNIAHIIDNCRSMLLASLDKKGIKLTLHVKQGNHVVKGDHTKLMQVILNVIKNSIEAIDMEKEEKHITISLESSDKTIELRVIDNGCGFDEETRQKFFQRGFTTKKSGTGLGLYNCRSIVESHNGTFDISSEGPGLGASTTIQFEN